jgi:hypothetical protein
MEKVCTVVNKTRGNRMTNKKYHYIYGTKVAFGRLTASKNSRVEGAILHRRHQELRGSWILSP